MSSTNTEFVLHIEPTQQVDLTEVLRSAGLEVEGSLSVSAAFEGEALVLSIAESNPAGYTRTLTREIRAENPGVYLDDLLEQSGVAVGAAMVFAVVDGARGARVVVVR